MQLATGTVGVTAGDQTADLAATAAADVGKMPVAGYTSDPGRPSDIMLERSWADVIFGANRRLSDHQAICSK